MKTRMLEKRIEDLQAALSVCLLTIEASGVLDDEEDIEIIKDYKKLSENSSLLEGK